MPHFTFPASPDGYTLEVLIGLRAQAMQALQAAGQPIPPPLRVRAILDTASDTTAVAGRVLQHFGIPFSTTVQTHTAAGPIQVNVFTISLSVSDPIGVSRAMLVQPEWVVTEFLYPTPQIEVLIGLDLANECLLILDGPGQRFTLGF